MSVAQLRDAGVGKQRVHRWVRDGLLHHVHHGVYAVGHRGTVASQRLQGGGAGMRRRRGAQPPRRGAPAAPDPPRTTAGRGDRADACRPQPAGHHHPSRPDAPPLDIIDVRGHPIATVPRMLLDLAPRTPPQELTRMCHEAWVHHETGPREVEACIAPQSAQEGDREATPCDAADATLSELEDGFLELLAEQHLPLRARTSTTAATRSTATGRPRAHGRAAELPLPRHAPRVRGRRRAPPALGAPRLQLRRRLRTTGADDR